MNLKDIAMEMEILNDESGYEASLTSDGKITLENPWSQSKKFKFNNIDDAMKFAGVGKYA